MKTRFLSELTVSGILLAVAQAQTNFNDGDLANGYIDTPGNWDNGLPVGQQGTLSQNAGYNSNATYSGYRILHDDGVFSRGAGLGSFVLEGGSVWVTDGVNASFSSGVRGVNVKEGSSFSLVNGTIATEGGRDTTIQNEDSTLTISGGSFSVGRALKVINDGSFSISGGSISAEAFGNTGFTTGPGHMDFTGGMVDAVRFVFQVTGTSATFGGTTTGSASFEDWGTGNGLGNSGDRHDDRKIRIGFEAGSGMTLTLESTARELDLDDDSIGDAGGPWAEALWGTGQLTYTDGTTVVSGLDPDPETNGWSVVSWSDATNSAVGFGTASAEYFAWTAAGSFGGSLSLGDSGGTPPAPLLITSFENVGGTVWEISISGDAASDYVFKSASDLDFSAGTTIENLTQGDPGDPGSIGGINASVVTTNGGGLATVRMTLTGDPSDFVRAEDAP